MKILTIVGSPRVNGNTHLLAQKFAEGAKMGGAEEVEEVFLSKLNIHPCIACYHCEKKDGVCTFNDDYPPIAEKMRASDGILLASPVYGCCVTAQMKAFFDRGYAFSYPNWVTGLEKKYAAFIVTAGSPPPEKMEPWYEVYHHPTFECMFRIGKDLKFADDRITSIRDKIDPKKYVDMTIDTLRIMYQYCIFVRMGGVLGALEVTGLGNSPKAVQGRPEDIQKAIEFGVQFAMTLRMIQKNVPLSFAKS